MAAFGGGFPVDFIGAISGNVFAEFFKIAAFSNLSLGMEAKAASVQKKGRQIFSFRKEIGINVDF